jgi:tetratricopeptide (TPR) repeat protein
MLTEAEKQHEVNKVTYLALGECYFRLGKEENYTKAIAYWNEFIRRWPADPMVIQVKSAVAQTYMKMKKWETAVEWWVQVETMAKAPELLGTKEYALSGQAFCWKELKRPEDEIVVLERIGVP